MGGQQSQLTYAVPLPNTGDNKDSTPIYRAATHPDGLVCSFDDSKPINNGWESFLHGHARNPSSNCLGRRQRQEDGRLSAEFKWMSYEEVRQAALRVGTGLLELPGGMTAETFADESYPPARSMKLLGLYSKNRVEWFLCELAAQAYNFTLVPLYDTLGVTAVEYIIERTRLHVIGCSIESLKSIFDACEKLPGIVKYAVVFVHPWEVFPCDLRSRAAEVGITLINFNELWLNEPSGGVAEPTPGDLSDVNTLCFTSGTTGNPKGVILSQRNVISTSAGIVRGPVQSGDFHLMHTDRVLSYLPLAHVFERSVCNVLMAIGGSIGVYSGDTQKLLDDVSALSPTVFVSVPRVFNRISDAVFKGVIEKGSIQKMFFERGLNAKLGNLRQTATTTNRFWDPLVFNKTKELMGDSLRYMISGGAPLDAVVQENIKCLFCAPLMEGYGLTETFGATFFQNPKDPVAGHIGGIIPADEFRLRSVPELSYFITDNPPRGEILIRGNTVTPGYFSLKEETAAAFDSEGWFCTGDIGILLPGGSIKVIDRKKNIFKLAQGEYVAPEKLEAVYLQVPEISQIFVFGYSDKNNLVAIVVPDLDIAKKWASANLAIKEIMSKDKIKSLYSNKDFRDHILRQMDIYAKENGLKGFEKVKAISLTAEPFTVENGLLTPTQKIKRHDARKYYQKELDMLYARLS